MNPLTLAIREGNLHNIKNNIHLWSEDIDLLIEFIKPTETEIHQYLKIYQWPWQREQICQFDYFPSGFPWMMYLKTVPLKPLVRRVKKSSIHIEQDIQIKQLVKRFKSVKKPFSFRIVNFRRAWVPQVIKFLKLGFNITYGPNQWNAMHIIMKYRGKTAVSQLGNHQNMSLDMNKVSPLLMRTKK